MVPEGYAAKTFTDIVDELQDAFRAEFGDSTDLSDESPDGQIIKIFGEGFADVWEMLGAAYSSLDPDNAEGVALESVCALTGTTREGATPSTVNFFATGVPGTSLAVGRTASVAVTEAKFDSTA